MKNPTQLSRCWKNNSRKQDEQSKNLCSRKIFGKAAAQYQSNFFH
jgi:hypothetical protein